MQVPWPVMNSLISLDLDHNNFGDNLAEPGRFNGLNVLQVTKTTIIMMTMIMVKMMVTFVLKGKYDDDDICQSLSLRGNGITKPPWESLEALQSLRELNLDQVFTFLFLKIYKRAL